MNFRPLVVIPTYNTGADLLLRTVRAATAQTAPVLVVVDGSSDGSAAALLAAMGGEPALRVLRKPANTGKGDALRLAASSAAADGFSHILAMDADGQHPADAIPRLLAAAAADPDALIMGQPQFGPDAPWLRLHGRRLTIFWTDLETLHCGLGDTLFGMRVYPLAAFNRAFRQTAFARGFDFDPEIAVRMTWLGCRPVQVPVPVHYLPASAGGVSHFHYLRDNAKLVLLHFRLVPECLLLRLIPMLRHRRQWKCAR
jgi:glycosyltransferase involved in cell wall biosynthesis